MVYAVLWFSSSLVIEWYKNREVLFFYNFKFFKKILCIIWGNGIFTEGASIGPAWFLISLLVVSIFYDFCKTYIFRESYKKIKLMILIVAFLVIGYKFNGKSFLPLKIIPSLTGIFFYWIGDMSKNIVYKLNNEKEFLLIKGIMSLVFLVLIVLNTNAYTILVSNLLPKKLYLMLIEGFLGIMTTIYFSIFLSKYYKISNFIEFYGKNSMLIMGIHSEIHLISRFILEKIGFTTSQTVIPVFIITLLTIIPMSIVINKYFPVFNGKIKIKEIEK